MKFYIDEQTKEILLSCKELHEPKISLLEEQVDETKHEKHMPKAEIENNHVKVKVGDIMHPMTPEHYITLIFLETDRGGQLKHLTYTDKPVVCFELGLNEQPIAVYEYCTLHGLWKSELK